MINFDWQDYFGGLFWRIKNKEKHMSFIKLSSFIIKNTDLSALIGILMLLSSFVYIAA